VPDGPTIEDELGQLTLYSNAATSWDYTSYTATLEPANLARVLAIEAQRMQPSCDAIDDASFLRERAVVLAEDRQRYTPQSAPNFPMLEEVYCKDHPYTRPIGSSEIATATRADVCTFVATHYAAERANLVITGRFDPREVKALIGRTFGRVKRVNLGRRAPAPAATLDGRVSRHPAPVARPTVLVVFRFAPWGDEGVVSWHVTQAALAAVLRSADDDHAWITNTSVFLLGGERARVMVAAVEVTSPDMLERGAEQVFARAALLTEELPARAFRNLVGHMTFDYIASWDNRAVRGDWIAQFMQFTDHQWFMLRELRTLAATRWHEKLPEMAGQLTQANSHVAMLLPSGHAATKVAAAIPTSSHDIGVWRAPSDVAEADRPLQIESTPADLEVESYASQSASTGACSETAEPLGPFSSQGVDGVSSMPPSRPLRGRSRNKTAPSSRRATNAAPLLVGRAALSSL
jgi:zinc protease